MSNTYSDIVDQKTCTHYAKVKMAGFKNRYECTRCHKFIVHTVDEEKATASTS